uniref:Uncharacterized protein n=1 Tax=viral metagenome TaxID=1070528 RepID=A0A6C0EB89_9ZZZZ
MDSIYDIIRQNKLNRFSSELQHTTDAKRKEIIKAIINKNQVKKTVAEQYNEKLKVAEQSQLKKEFFRLKSFQKEEVIKKYLEEKMKDNVDEGVKTLMKLLEDKKVKPKDVDYDMENAKILSIKGIDIDDDEVKIIKKAKAVKKTKAVKKSQRNKSDSESNSDSSSE